jgi:hypothetical protein
MIKESHTFDFANWGQLATLLGAMNGKIVGRVTVSELTATIVHVEIEAHLIMPEKLDSASDEEPF